MSLLRWRFVALFTLLFTIVALSAARMSAVEPEPDDQGDFGADEFDGPQLNRAPDDNADAVAFSFDDFADRRGLQTCLHERIAAVDFVCQLNEEQKGKLLLAGRVEIARLFSNYERRRYALEHGEGLDAKERRILIDEAGAAAKSLMSEPFDDASFFAKVVKGVLTPSQRRRWEGLLYRTSRLTGFKFRDQPPGPDTATEARFPETVFDDSEMVRLSELKSLECLVLESTAITDAGLAHLRGLTKLEELDLGGNRISDQGLSNVKALRSLKYLGLRGTQITDAGIASLGKLIELDRLDLRDTKIDGSGLTVLAKLGSLRTLDLAGTRITDRTLQHVGICRRLERLSLRGIPVSDAGLAQLKNLENIRQLDLG